MNKSIVKIILLLSIFLGIVSGLLTIVPYAGEIIFWLLITVAAPVVIIFMTRAGLLEINTVRQSAVLGGIIGFCNFYGRAVCYGKFIQRVCYILPY